MLPLSLSRSNPSLLVLARLANALNVEIEDIVSGHLAEVTAEPGFISQQQ